MKSANISENTGSDWERIWYNLVKYQYFEECLVL